MKVAESKQESGVSGKNTIKQPQEESKINSTGKEAEAAMKGAFKCTSCAQAFFESKDDFRNHYKSEWHQFNLRQKAEVWSFHFVLRQLNPNF